MLPEGCRFKIWISTIHDAMLKDSDYVKVKNYNTDIDWFLGTSSLNFGEHNITPYILSKIE